MAASLIPCCGRRRQRASTASGRASEFPDDRRPGEGMAGLSICIAIHSIDGERQELPPLPADADIEEVKLFVKKAWGMPVAAQKLLLGHTVIEGGRCLGDLFPDYMAAAASEDAGAARWVDLTCVRAALPQDLQALVDGDLLSAAASGNGGKAELALAEGAGVECHKQGITPLLLAIAAGSDATAQLLRNSGASEPARMEAPPNMSPGHAMARGEFAELVRLLAARADPNTRLRQGEGIRDTRSGTLLHACCAMHQREGADVLVELLLHLRADANAPDAEGDSPLAHARYFGAVKMYGLLERSGATVSGPYYRGPLRRLLGAA